MTEGEAIVVPVEALGQVKAYLRVDGTAEDDGIAALIGAAAGVCEAFVGLTLVARMFVEVVEQGSGWTRLGRTPVRAVESVADAGGAVLPGAVHATDIDADGDGWVRLSAVPGLSEGAARRVSVGYRAGLAESWDGLPAPLRQGVIRLAAHMYVHRGGADDPAPPAAVTALWRPYRRLPFGRIHDRRSR